MSYWKRARRWAVLAVLLAVTIGAVLADSAHAQEQGKPIKAGETAEGGGNRLNGRCRPLQKQLG